MRVHDGVTSRSSFTASVEKTRYYRYIIIRTYVRFGNPTRAIWCARICVRARARAVRPNNASGPERIVLHATGRLENVCTALSFRIFRRARDYRRSCSRVRVMPPTTTYPFFSTLFLGFRSPPPSPRGLFSTRLGRRRLRTRNGRLSARV